MLKLSYRIHWKFDFKINRFQNVHKGCCDNWVGIDTLAHFFDVKNGFDKLHIVIGFFHVQRDSNRNVHPTSGNDLECLNSTIHR